MNKNRISPELKIALLYVLIGGLWIVFSDALLASLIPNPAFYATLQTFKGWLFIAVSALMLFWLLRREWTRRRTVERQFIESDERYRQLFENSMDAILLTAPDGSIHAANQAACDLFQRTEAEIQQGGRNGLVNLADPRLKPALEERARTGRFHGELTFLRRDGTFFEGDVSTNLFKNADGVDRTSMIIRDITEQKRVKETLRKSEQTLATIFNKAPFAAGLTSLTDGHYVEVNEAFERMFGFSKAEILGKTSLELGMYPDPQMRERSAALFREHGFVHNLDMRLQTRTGELHDVLINSDLVEIGGEKYILTTANDITEQMRAEEKIAYQAYLLANVNDAMLASDEKFVLTAWNSAAERIYGWKAEEVLGKSGTEILQTEFLTISRPEAIKQLIETGEFFAEVRQPRKDGTKICIETRATALRDLNGRTTGYVTVNRDITDRKQAEERLRLSNERFVNAFYTSPAGMTITRIADGKFIDVNEAFLRMFEFTREEVIGHTSTELNMWTPEERKKLIDEQIRSGGLQNFELQARSKSGRVVNILFSSKPIELEGEIHHITTMIDITEHKRVEDAMRTHHAELENLYATTPVGLALIDQNLRFLRINEQLAAINGKPVEAHLGRTIAEVLPELADVLEPIYRRVLDKGELVLNMEIHGATPAAPNVPRDWLASYHPVRAADGSVTGVSITVLEITERKQVEMKLMESAKVHRDTLERISDGFISFDKNWRYTYLNKKAAEILNRTQAEMIGKNVWEEYPESVGLPFHKAYYDAMETQNYIYLEEHYPPLNMWFENHIYPSPDGLSVFIKETTERKRAEAELRVHRDRLADLSRQLVQTHETESRAIGRELHDQIGQMLTALKITLDISRQLPVDAAAKKVAQAQELAGELLERVSHLSLELRPPMLAKLSKGSWNISECLGNCQSSGCALSTFSFSGTVCNPILMVLFTFRLLSLAFDLATISYLNKSRTLGGC